MVVPAASTRGKGKMPYSVSRGVKTHYEVSGEGPAMVLIHANPFDHTLFLYQILYFSALFTVVSPDLRGYGRSDIVTTPFTLGDLADDVYGVCRQEGITEAIVVGEGATTTDVTIELDQRSTISGFVMLFENPAGGVHQAPNRKGFRITSTR